jgi:hypothetical protein
MEYRIKKKRVFSILIIDTKGLTDFKNTILYLYTSF